MSCVEEGLVDVSLFKKNSTSIDTLNYTPLNATIHSGETIGYSFSNGQAPFLVSTGGVGTFNNLLLEYTAPRSSSPLAHQISVSDDVGNTAKVKFNILGFEKNIHLEQTKSFGEQNYPTNLAKTANGDIYMSSVVIDTPGWERWVIWKSTDIGSNWSIVDEFIFTDEGESHPLGIETKNNDIYVCGYAWESGGIINSEWFIRKSTDQGLTWQTIDRWNLETGNNVCNDIEHDSSTDDFFASGYAHTSASGDVGIIKQSTDDGQNWSVIFNDSDTRDVYTVKASPAGVIWAVAESDLGAGTVLYKGTYAGSWTWSGPYSIGINSIPSVAYQKFGKLLIESETTAYYASKHLGRWVISKTTDSGLNWTNIYTDGLSSEGVDILKTTSGDLISVGSNTTSPRNFEIIRSTDNGATWTKVLSDNTPAKEGTFVIEANDNSLLSITYEDGGSQQVHSYRSTDNGVTWSSRGEARYLSAIYTEINDYKEDSLGNIFTAGFTMMTDNNVNNTWSINKSSDNGISWSQSDILTDPTFDLSAHTIEPVSGGYVYASGGSRQGLLLRQSSDSGASWTTLELFNTGTTNNYKAFMGSDSFENIYYVAWQSDPAVSTQVRKASSNGTVRTTVGTFPMKAGSTNFSARSLEVLSDDSIWLGATEKDGGVTTTTVIYRTLDQGVSWTEMLRTPGNSSSIKVQRTSDGKLFASNLYKLSISTDNGVTWNSYYDGSLGSLKDFIIGNNDQVYILVNKKVITYSTQTSSWYEVWDMNDKINNAHNPAATGLFKCSASPIKVCLNVLEVFSGQEGDKNYLWPLKLP